MTFVVFQTTWKEGKWSKILESKDKHQWTTATEFEIPWIFVITYYHQQDLMLEVF